MLRFVVQVGDPEQINNIALQGMDLLKRGDTKHQKNCLVLII